LKSERYDVETIAHIAMGQLLVILKTGFERCFCHWQEQWNKCMWWRSLLWRGL